MKTMKILTLFCLLSLGFFCKSVNAQMYIVSVHSENQTYDSVYVYSPTGEVTGYTIAVDEPTHFKELNVILNGVIDKGYKVMEVVITYGAPADEIYYFTKP